MESPSEFDLQNWLKEAVRMIVCTGCYGSGEDKWNEGRACPKCNGVGRSEAEPHVIRLITYIRKLQKEAKGNHE